ncbi:MAG TPA: hypothetical protein VKB07_04120 [Gaiellaceae bacterium]|nr:hypothetical protein [Gaiellaceae bacterium]
MKRLAAGTLLAVGAVGGARAIRRRGLRRVRLDVYYDDGAMLSLPPATAEAAAALARAREALRAAAEP